MTKKAFAALMVLMLLLLAAVPGTADFGSAGNRNGNTDGFLILFTVGYDGGQRVGALLTGTEGSGVVLGKLLVLILENHTL